MNKINRTKWFINTSCHGNYDASCYSFFDLFTLDDIELQLDHCVEKVYAVGI